MNKMSYYYIYKAFNLTLSWAVYIFHWDHPETGVCRILRPREPFSGTVVLAFWDAWLVHLGDQLFNEALVRYLVAKGRRVVVCGGTPLRAYFMGLGAEVMSVQELRATNIKGAMFVAKDDIAFQFMSMFGRSNSFLGIDYAALNTRQRISPEILRITLEAFVALGSSTDVDGKMKDFDLRPVVPPAVISGHEDDEWVRHISALGGKGAFIFNNYAASNFLSFKKRTSLLSDMAERLKKEGFKIIHTGSGKDKLSDRKTYDFVDLDLRGKLDPMAVIRIFSLPNIAGFIGFDAFVMHAASLFRKDLHVVIKDKAHEDVFRDRFIPMYPGAEGTLKELL